jgi:hypothetical protein
MLLDHADDPTARGLWDQYRLGRDLLVAPVITEGATDRQVYLPAGRWWHLLEERWYNGGTSVRIDAPLHSIPVFARDGALVPLAFKGETKIGAPLPAGLVTPDCLALLLVAGGAMSTEIHLQGWHVRVFRAADGTLDIRTTGDGPKLMLVLCDPSNEARLNGAAISLEPKVILSKPMLTVALG